MTASLVTVFGATGLAGGAVARSFAKAGWTVQAATRDTESEQARALAASGIVPVYADLDERASIRQAIEGSAVVYLSGPSLTNRWDVGQAVQGINVCDAVAEVATPHFIYQSAMVREARGVLGFGSKRAIEERIAELGISATISRPGIFMDIFLERFPVRRTNEGYELVFPLPADCLLDLIAVEDVGRAAVAVATDPDKHVGQTYELVGDNISFRDIARTLTEQLGAPVKAVSLPVEQLAQAWPQGEGLFRWFASARTLASPDEGQALVGSMQDFRTWAIMHGDALSRF
ncbi:NmrA family NAD(P)-binding protein [Sphingobium terrigena]|nr:NmrA family NAD(P)-binding protein [Sphingobium terrigena]